MTLNVDGVRFKMVFVEGGEYTAGKGQDTHRVVLKNYYIGETEVTQALWTALMGYHYSKWPGDNMPAEHLSDWDVKNFLIRLNEKTGHVFRLPTEEEWEYAARGGKKSKGYTYAGSNNIDDVAWHYDNSGNGPHPVKQKQPNELGLYDMSGNVAEWCSKWYEYYSASPMNKIKGPAPDDPVIHRGGSWISFAKHCTVTYRNFFSGSGLRLVMEQ